MTVRLAAAGDRVTIDPAAGGRLTSAVLGGGERLVTHPPDHVDPAMAPWQWGVFVMAPWAGRIAHGDLAWDGVPHRLDTVAGDGHALHGITTQAAWTVTEADDQVVELAVDLAGGGWPFGGHARHRVELQPGRLQCALTVTAATTSMPAWVGWHPCFRRPDRGDLRIRIDADHVLATHDRIPTGARLPVGGDTDLRAAPVLGPRRLDTVYVGASQPAYVAWPDLDLHVSLDAPTTWVVFTPEHEACVEPQTGWPDALALAQRGVAGTGARTLEPGASLTTTMTWSWRPRPPAADVI